MFGPTFSRRAAKLASRFGVGRGRKLQLEQALAQGLDMSRLHLGCGNIHIPGWCNVDVLKTGATDVVLDIVTLPGLRSASVQSIYSCHVLEHFAHGEVPGLLERWFDVLAPGGELRISVPDIDEITRIYQKNLAHFQIPGNQPWIALIYGGQKDQYDFHKTGFNFAWMKHLLTQTGFEHVERYPHSPHFIAGVVDNSIATAPFGEYFSLNVCARRPRAAS